MQIFNGHNQWSFPADTDQQVSYGLKCSIPFFLGLKVKPGFILNFQGQQILKSRKSDWNQLLIKLCEVVLHLLGDSILPLSFLDSKV